MLVIFVSLAKLTNFLFPLFDFPSPTAQTKRKYKTVSGRDKMENITVERDAHLRSHQADGPTTSFLDGNTSFYSTPQAGDSNN